jgi:ACS family hexuronate transporter-like MFS transporter
VILFVFSDAPGFAYDPVSEVLSGEVPAVFFRWNMIKIPYFRWWIGFLLFIATGLSFFDRQVLSILAPAIMRDVHLNDVTYSRAVFAFILSYTVMFTVSGRLIDRLGLRMGLGLSVAIWSLASLGHSLVHNVWELGLALFVLGVGEGGCFPGATKGAVEWFPEKERSAAIGLAIGGASFGAVVGPPLTVRINSILGWRGAFLIAGAMGFLWLIIWAVFFALPEDSRFLSAEELRRITAREGDVSSSPTARPSGLRPELVPLRMLLQRKETWGLMASRFLLDPVFYFYMFWIPQFLSEARHVPLATIGRLTWIPFLTLGASQVAGGWLSDHLVKRRVSVNTARKTVMGLAALLTPFSILSMLAQGPGLAICLMSILMFAHGFWITNYITMTSDLFPEQSVGTVVGLCGSAGGFGGILSSLAIGLLAQHARYNVLFIACGVMYLVAYVLILLTVRKVQPLNFETFPCAE